MKKLTSSSKNYALICLLIILVGCSSAGLRIHTAPSDYEKTVREYIAVGEYTKARNKAVEALKKYPDNLKITQLLTMVLFKQQDYENTYKILDRVFNNEAYYDSLNQDKHYDLLYAFVYSQIELGKYDRAENILTKRVDNTLLSKNNRVKNEILAIRLEYRYGNSENTTHKINNLLKEYTLNSDLKLNLSYILAELYFKQNKISTSLEIIGRILENDKSKIYFKRCKKILDQVINTGESSFFENYNDLLVATLRQLYNSTDDKSLRLKIVRNINMLENSSVGLEFQDETAGKTASISGIKILNDKNNTKVIFSAKDSLQYSHEYQGNTLVLTIINKTVNSKANFLTPAEGSGINNFKWQTENGNTVFRIEMSGSYDMSFEELADDFERGEKASDRYQLLLNILIPDDETNSQFESDLKKVKKYTIVIDPGHGGDDVGAVSVMEKADGGKYTEKEMNLILSKELKKYLEKRGYRVFLTRDRDYFPSLMERNRIAQNRNADMFLSVHLNAAGKKTQDLWQTDRYIGTEMVVRNSLGAKPKIINSNLMSSDEWLERRKKALNDHKALSEILSTTLPLAMEPPYNKERSIKGKDLAIFSGMTIPHALIESGFIINNDNLNYLLSEKGQRAFCTGIFKGIEEFRRKIKK